MDRPDPPGQILKEDQFEIAWHQTAVALLEGFVRPDYVDRYGVAPLGQLMSALPGL